LLTREFNQLVCNRLSENGIFATNVIGHPTDSRLVTTVTQTISKDFNYVSLFSDTNKKHEQNIWILASRTPIRIGSSVKHDGTKGVILTDDNAPVEFIIASDLISRKK
jgi:spermidine synthase